MAEPAQESKPTREGFSWERWLLDGLRALRQTLFHYDFGLPEEFWYHLERAAHELLTASRILLKSLRRRYYARAGDAPARGQVEIDWE